MRKTRWFELIDTFHKLLLTSVLAFFPREAQLSVGMAIAVIYMVVLLRENPYLRPTDDALHMLAQVRPRSYLLLVTDPLVPPFLLPCGPGLTDSFVALLTCTSRPRSSC